MKIYISVVIAICLFGCSKEDPNPADNAVHLVGYVTDSYGDGEGVAGYWKDGEFNALTSSNIISRATSLYVEGSSVLIGGTTRVSGSRLNSVFWKDGVETVIEEAFGEPMIASHNQNVLGIWISTTAFGYVINKNGISKPMIDTAYNYAPMAMTVSEDDVYASGYSLEKSSSPDDPVRQHAQYWKNGQLLLRESKTSNALGISSHQNDIYIAGHVYGPDFSKACYWKNGQRVDLTDGSKVALARSIFVTQDHVYVAGMMEDQAVYWKDGVVVNLTNKGTFSTANSIFVKGTDIHVAGYEHGHPAYWKNDVKQNIDNQDKLGRIISVVVGSNR